MSQLTKERMGEIALKLVEQRLMKSSMPAPADFRRELGNAAKEIDVDLEDLISFYEAFLPKVLGKMLGRKSVSLVTSD